MAVVREIKGRQVVISDDKAELEDAIKRGYVTYSSSEMEIAKRDSRFKLFSQWLFEAKAMLATTQLIAVRPGKTD